MAFVTTQLWTSLERWRTAAFLIGGGLFVVDAALLVMDITSGTEPAAFGQALVGASWTAAFVGLLGFYPSLVEGSRRLVRAGAVFAVVGGLTMAGMAATMLGYATGVLGGGPSGVSIYFLPGVFLGIVLGFGLFGAASLRTEVYSRNVSFLFLLLPLAFLFNLGTGMAGFNPLLKVLGVVCVLALTMLSIGYLLRTGRALTDRERVGAGGVSAGHRRASPGEAPDPPSNE